MAKKKSAKSDTSSENRSNGAQSEASNGSNQSRPSAELKRVHDFSGTALQDLHDWVWEECSQFPTNKKGSFSEIDTVKKHLTKMRPDFHPQLIDRLVGRSQSRRVRELKVLAKQSKQAPPNPAKNASAPKTRERAKSPSNSKAPSANPKEKQQPSQANSKENRPKATTSPNLISTATTTENQSITDSTTRADSTEYVGQKLLDLLASISEKSDAAVHVDSKPRAMDSNTSSSYSQTLATSNSHSRLDSRLNLLLSNEMHMDRDEDDENEDGTLGYDIKNAILVSAGIIDEVKEDLLPQYGLLGTLSAESSMRTRNMKDARILLNTNIPFSAFICGVQGSGKSHTTSCLLENLLIPSPMLGHLQSPLSALVFHFSEFHSITKYNPSEAVYLSASHSKFPNHPAVSKITVLVSPSNYYDLHQMYTRIPNVQVARFKLKPHMLDISTMLVLMDVDQSQNPPLYMAQIVKILRDMATEAKGGFNYLEFKRRIGQQKFNRMQIMPLNQRLELLESFLDLDGSCTEPLFRPGEVTIMDLSCPFVDSNTACVLFKIGMRKYLESNTAGKTIVLDEAHKFMIDTPGARDLNEFLLTTIRQQRHFGARVIVSTQEPTISPKLIDLCAMTVVHRFTSPEWFKVLGKHICVLPNDDENSSDMQSLFRKILNLRTGEALVYAPTAILAPNGTSDIFKATDTLLKVKIRQRVTWDGGQSVVAHV